MNKKKTLVVALAAFLMIGMASLAYFTDVETGTSTVKAGDVSLTDGTVDVDTDLMVPGDTKTLALNATYTGNVDAKVRVKLTNTVESVPATEDEGFRLKRSGVELDLTTPQFIDADDVTTNGDAITLDLVLELLAASDNDYQNATYSVVYEIQVLQADHTDWDTIDQGLIVAK